MRKPTLWLIAIAILVIIAVSVTRLFDDEPGLASPTSTTDLVAGATSTTRAAPIETTTTSHAPPLEPGATVCDRYGNIVDVGAVTSTDLIEASGLAVSRTTPDVMWSHNDSRGGPQLFALSPTGEDLGAYGVPDAFAFDWEDIAAGPGPDGTGNYLYVGDIGDNFLIRSGKFTVYRVPDVDPASLDDNFTEAIALPYRYPDGVHNAEAIFIDPVDPALYIITKDKEGSSVYRGSIVPTGDEIELDFVTTLFLDAEVSGADISWDGRVIALRGYRTVWMWNRPTGTTVADAFNTDVCTAPSPEELQGEAISFDGALGYWTISEGQAPTVHSIPVQP